MSKKWIVFILGFLSGCSTPDSYQPVTGVCKSCKPYFVRGSWYEPQRHYNYSEKGLASWYGPRFHGKRKANGEVFNQDKLTAAHRTLPLPTVARVTNLQSGASLIVVIDDRGPFTYAGRIIDLSKGSAQTLGAYQKGLAEVLVEALPDESHALSLFLKKHKPNGLTWREIYDNHIAGQAPCYAVSTFDVPPPRVTPTRIHPKKKQKKTNSHQQHLARLIKEQWLRSQKSQKLTGLLRSS